MEMFFAGGITKVTAEFMIGRSYNKLYSYYSERKEVAKFAKMRSESNGCTAKLILDSGAYSAWTKKKIIDVDEYIKFLLENENNLYLYGQMDVIPGDLTRHPSHKEVVEAAEKTWENYLYMRERVNQPEKLLYTFHVGEPYNFLEQALKWKDEKGNLIPYIALGGMVGKSSKIRIAFLERCFNIIEQLNPNVKVHAFGMTSRALLPLFPLTSADSTSHLMQGFTGTIYTNYGDFNVSNKGTKKVVHLNNKKEQTRSIIIQEIESKGYKLKELAEDFNKRLAYNMDHIVNEVITVDYNKKSNKKRKLF